MHTDTYLLVVVLAYTVFTPSLLPQCLKNIFFLILVYFRQSPHLFNIVCVSYWQTCDELNILCLRLLQILKLIYSMMMTLSDSGWQQISILELKSTELKALQGSHVSWKVLDFFPQNSTTWKVLETHFGPGKSWKNILESHAFF